MRILFVFALLAVAAFGLDSSAQEAPPPEAAKGNNAGGLEPAAPEAGAPEIVAPPAPRVRRGKLIRIAGNADSRVMHSVRRQCDTAIRQAKEKSEWPVLIFEIHPGRISIFDAEELAAYIAGPDLAGAFTVAYLPDETAGHAVLLALACNEIIMGPEASIGNAAAYEPGGDREVDPRVKAAYTSIANLRKTVPLDVAISMVDPQSELLQVETDKSRYLVLRENLEALSKKEAVDVASAKVIKKPGSTGVYSALQARELGFVNAHVEGRAALARQLRVSREAVDDDPSQGGDWRPAQWKLRGLINKELTDQVQKGIQKEISDNDVNFICLWIDSAGGSALDSINLANFLLSLNAAERRTVAYIPRKALGDAAFIALACDQIVMAPDAELGGAGDLALGDQALLEAVVDVKAIAGAKFRSRALAAAMIDEKLAVHQYRRKDDGILEYMTDAEFEALEDVAKWEHVAEIKRPGRPLTLSGERAVELDIARETARDFGEFKAIYGLQDDVRLVEPSWADQLIEALASPGFAWILLFIGGMALVIELHAPGIGFGGLVAALCFALFFWSAYLGGTAGWLEIILFCMGAVLLIMEIFVLPGFGIFGITGGLMVVFSLVLASQTFIVPRNEYQIGQLRNSLLALCGAGVGTFVAGCVIRAYFPRAPGISRMMLAPPSDAEAADIARRESLAQWEHLLGKTGVAQTPLLPSGKALFDNELVDVVADGQSVDRGRQVVVVEVRGNRVVVRSAT